MGLFEVFSNSSMMHAAVVHLPIVFVLLGVPLIYYLAISQQKTEALRWFTVGFFAVTAVISYVAMVTGHGAMDRIPNDHRVAKEAWDLIGQHEEMGERVWIFAAVVAVLMALSAIPVRIVRQAFVGVGMLAAIVLAVWVAILGHFGGMLVYNHGIGTPMMGETVAQAASVDATGASGTNPGPVADGATHAPPADDLVPKPLPIDMASAKAISFTKDVLPILQENCEECHNPDKMRGDFDTTSIAAMTEGGKKGGVGIVPGKPDEGSLVLYVRGAKQPQMPKGEDPLTDEQLHVIRQWIAAGAIDDSSGAPALSAPAETAPNAEMPAPVEPEAPEQEPEREAPEAEAPAEPAAEAAAATANGAGLSVDDLLFSGGPEDLLVKRRAYRMALVAQPPSPPETNVPVHNDIDRYIAAKWQRIDPAFTGQVCDDSAFARRAYLDVIGVIPTADEVKAFVEDTTEDKHAKLIDALLARSEEYAAHWTPFWEDALCSNGNHQGGVGTRGNYRDWIFNSFKENKAYDAMVAELLDPHMPNHPGRYVLRQDHTRVLKSAADTAQVFLGTQMKCAACHNHFDNREWSQRRFYGFAGYFANEDLELIKCEAHTGEYVPTGFVFDMPGIPSDVPATEDERAARIAQLVIDPCNPRFAKTMVNRLWKRFLGMGLFEPADNYREDTPASHPELLEWLAYDFMANGYDIKHTMRTILASRTYRLAYDAALEDRFDIAKPMEPRYFRSPRLRRMTAEQLLDSVKVALGEKLADGGRVYRSDESTPLTRALGRPATRNEVSTARPEDAAVVQTLELLNGDEYHDRIYGGELVFAAAQHGRDAGAYDSVIDDLYWSVLGRAPNESERAAGSEFVRAAAVDLASPDIEDTVAIDEALPDGVATGETWTQINGPDGPVFSGGTSWKLSVPAAPTPGPSETAPEADATGEAVDAKTASADARASGIAFAVDDGSAGAALAQDQTDEAQPSPIQPEAPAEAAPVSAAAPAIVEQSLGALSQSIVVNPDDVLYAYVYIDPSDPPKAIMLQWKSADSWEHRAYWGENVLKTDVAEGPARHAMGALPEHGKWMRLEVPAYLVNLGRNRQGIGEISIIQAGGTVYWDRAGAMSAPLGGPTTAVGDALWALVTSPEFQYIR